MHDKPSPREDHKFDTLGLLAGLSEEDTGRYSIDDILSEFGGWTEKKEKPEEPPAPPAENVDAAAPPEDAPDAEPRQEESSIIDQIQHAIDREMELNMAMPEPVIQLEEEKPKEPEQDFGDPELNQLFQDKKIRLVQQTPVDQTPHRTQKQPPRREPEGSEEPERPKEREEAPRRRRQEAPHLEVVEEPEPVPDASELFKKCSKAIRPARSRMTMVLLLTAAAIFWTAANQFGWSEAAPFANSKVVSKVLLALMVLCALLSADVLADGVKGVFSLKFTPGSLITLAFLVTAIDAALCGEGQQVPFCAVVCLQFYFASWGSTLKKVSLRRALKPLQKLEEEPAAAAAVEDAWEGGDLAAAVSGGSAEEHVRGLLRPNLAEQRMRVYAPVVVVLSLALAFFIRVKTGNSLTWAWSSMMIGALPVAGFISYYRPFAILSGKLMKEGAAVSGWSGASRLAGTRGIVLRDEDVFPADHVTLNGMKVYGSYSVGQTVGYAAAVIETSGSGLTPLFQELRRTNNGRFFNVAQFRRYEGGGYGAEIGGDVVLLGSLRFMQLMGVYMHEGTKVRNAVYLSVNGEMCAVFALNYAPSGKVRKGLRQIADANGITPVFATRDFLITPLLVEERYKVPNDSLEFPSAEERNRLAQLPDGYPYSQGAILARPEFSAFAGAVAGARLLRLVTSVSTTINLVGGAVGLGLMCLLTYLGAQSAITAMNMLLFALVWSLPTLILTGWVGRY